MATVVTAGPTPLPAERNAVTRRRRAAAVAAVLLLGACTPAPAPTDPTPDVPAVAVNDVNPTPRERVVDSGVLRFSISAIPDQWNPRHPDGRGPDAAAVRAPLSPGHLVLDAAGRATANPDFVTGLEVTHDERTRVVLSLNPLAVWGDGASVTAEDWVATWRAVSGQVAGVQPVADDGWDTVEEVSRGDGPYEVVVDYRTLEPDWAQPLLAGPLPAAGVADAAAFDGWTGDRPVRFAGPFVVDHVDRLQGVVTLTRNPRWWGDPPRLDAITFRVLPVEAVPAAFQHNELDLLDIGTSRERMEQARGAADTVVRTAPGTAGRRLEVSTAGVLADADLRHAVLQALDRGAIARADLTGIAQDAAVWNNPLLLPSQPGYVDQARATGLDTDATAAGETLTRAGWALVDGHRERDGSVLTLTFGVPAGDPLAEREFAAVATQLGELGVSVRRATGPEPADLTPHTASVGAFPLAGLPDGAGQVTEAALRVSFETDPVRRADVASQLTRLMWQETTTIPLYQVPQNVAVRNGLANLGAPAYASVPWEDVGWSR